MAGAEVKQYEKDLAKWKKKVDERYTKYRNETKKDLETIEIINQTIKEVKRRKEAEEPEMPVKPEEELVKDREKLQRNVDNKTKAFNIFKELPPERPVDAPKTDLKSFWQKLVKDEGIPVG